MQSAGCLFGARTRAVRVLAGVAGGAALVVTLGAASAPSVRPAPVTNYAGQLFGVTALSATDAWAVGSGSSAGTSALHWNGSSWAKVPLPHPGTENILNGLSAVSASDVWGVGVYYNNHVGKTLTVRRDGSRWSQVPSPSYGGTSLYGSVLTGVTAVSAASAWAVGLYSKPGPEAEFQTLILHWDGTSWTRVPSPEPPNSFLSGVAAVSASDAWAVGEYTTTSNVITALMLHWNGTRWTQVTVPFPAGALGTMLSAVSADSPADAWAVGGYSVKSTGLQAGLTLHWNGNNWTRVATPAPSGTVFRFLNGVAAFSPTDAWAVGADSGNNNGITLILHWDGTRWTQIASPDPGGNNGNDLYGVATTSASDAWAVGDYRNGNSSPFDLILRWNGTSWTRS